MRKLNLQTIDNVNEWFGRLVSYLILGIIGITIWEVVLRYMFNSPTVWVSETSEFLFAYCFLLQKLGYLITTTLLLLFLFKTASSRKWWFVIAGSVLTAAVTYLGFTFLGLRFPRGIFRI